MAKDCSNVAVYDIKIDLVNGHGDFCNGCKRYFEERDLIITCSKIALGVGEGKLEGLTDEIGSKMHKAQ